MKKEDRGQASTQVAWNILQAGPEWAQDLMPHYCVHWATCAALVPPL